MYVSFRNDNCIVNTIRKLHEMHHAKCILEFVRTYCAIVSSR